MIGKLALGSLESYEEVKKDMALRIPQNFFNRLKEDKLYTQSKNDFYTQFFPNIKPK